jgi:hypothetical protein
MSAANPADSGGLPPLATGRAFRVAPSQSRQPVASFWKFWVEGNELYAMNRDLAAMKISVHESGQIHLRLEKRDLRPLAPPLALADTSWNHVLEIRYLIAPDRHRPTLKKIKKNEKAFVVEVADGNALILNLIVAAHGVVPGSAPPHFCGARQLWRSSLADGRPVMLVGRIMPLDAENQQQIKRLRGIDGPKVTFSGAPGARRQVEVYHVFWSPQGGNIVLVVPAGEETIRKLGEPASSTSEGPDSARSEVDFTCPNASCEVKAPNGAVIATFEIVGSEGRVQLSKNRHIKVQIGVVRQTMRADTLIAGHIFETPPFRLTCVPTVAGLRPRDWAYTASCHYDGARLTLRVRTLSASLIADTFSASPSSLSPSEQIILSAPVDGLVLTGTALQPKIESPLTATLLLCDRHVA